MRILVCVKRVPATAGSITLTADGQAIDTRFLGFTISPHEECAVEEAARLVETLGGEAVVLTVGPPDAERQLRDAVAVGMTSAVLVETDGGEVDPAATAREIVRAAAETGEPFDLLLFGNEAADSGDAQVAVRVAHLLDLPVITGVKGLRVEDGAVVGSRQAPGGWEDYEATLPAVVSVREGLNLPRYPSLPGRLKAKRQPVTRVPARREPAQQRLVRLALPEQEAHSAQLLGTGTDAVPAIVELLKRLGVLEK
jgi:electron transfer flavoprotein beta subunit